MSRNADEEFTITEVERLKLALLGERLARLAAEIAMAQRERSLVLEQIARAHLDGYEQTAEVDASGKGRRRRLPKPLAEGTPPEA
jgi:hypothetical protein